MPPAPERDRFFSLANLMSLSRVPLAGVFWLTLHRQPGFPWAPLAVLGMAGITDVLDGRLARYERERQTPPPLSVRGAWLDPLCDKIFVGVVLIALFFERSPSLGILSLIYARELVQIPTALGYRFLPYFRERLRYNFTSTLLGKFTTVLQFAAILSLLFNLPATLPLALASGVVGLWTAGDYLRRARRIAREANPN